MTTKDSASGVIHIRLLDGEETDRTGQLTPTPNGGFTIAYLVDPENDAVTVGTAICSPLDTFDRKRGLQIAVGRLTCDRPGTADIIQLVELEELSKGIYDGEPASYRVRSDGVAYLDKSYPLAMMLARQALDYFAHGYLPYEDILSYAAEGSVANLFATENKFFFGFSSR